MDKINFDPNKFYELIENAYCVGWTDHELLFTPLIDNKDSDELLEWKKNKFIEIVKAAVAEMKSK